MKCDDAAALVARHADGELDALRRHSVGAHLRACAQCAAAYDRQLALRARLRTELPYFALPEGLAARIESAVARDSKRRLDVPGPREAGRWRWLAWGAFGGSAATLLAFALATAVVGWRTDRALAAEAVATHVRATLTGHLVEVASSDQHTVKPWISARIDYSPPVQDLVDEGCPLQGGRLDVLGERKVATLVYRYRNHVVDVFVRPQSPQAPAPLRSIRGFNVAEANRSGWDWLAVSDVAPDVLAGFVERLAEKAAVR